MIIKNITKKMSFVSVIVPAFHLYTTDLEEIKDQCSIEFNTSEDNFDLIKINNDSSINNYGIIFNESSLSLSSIEDLIYEKDCIQALCQKTFESLQIITKKLNELDSQINNYNNYNNISNHSFYDSLKKDLLLNNNEENEGETNHNSCCFTNTNTTNTNNKSKDFFENYGNSNNINNNNISNNTKIILKNIRQEFNNMVKEFELLNKKSSPENKYKSISGRSEEKNEGNNNKAEEKFSFSNNNLYHFHIKKAIEKIDTD